MTTSSELIEHAGHALEFEDRYLTGCAHVRGWENRPIGICTYVNERYYQFVVWRALLSSFPWRPQPEGMGHDFAFYVGERDDEPIALAEMKVWNGTTSEAAIRGIRGDLDGLSRLRPVGIMLILLCCPKQQTNELKIWLCEQLGIADQQDLAAYTFDTPPYPPNPPPFNFVVMGFFVTKTVTA